MRSGRGFTLEWPPVTWLMPVRNGMPFLAATLASIAAQTYANHHLLVWDNGSTDGTLEMLRAWIPDRIAGTIVADRPLSLGVSRAALVEMATTELCACIDADDINLPERLERQVAVFERSPDLVALGAVPDIIDENDRPLPDWYYPLRDAEIRWRTRWQTSLNASSVMFRRSSVLAAGNYRDRIRGQDLDLWMRLAREGRMEALPQRLVRYRRHTTNHTIAYTDYHALDRTIATGNAGALFADTSEQQAMQLWEAAYPRYNQRGITPRHFVLLRDAARKSATALRLPAEYFTGTTYYARQRRFMLLNMGFGRLNIDGQRLYESRAKWLRLRR